MISPKIGPPLLKGALVQLLPDVIAPIPNIVVFQYNPEKISHTITPWNPLDTDKAQRGASTPTVQPYDPQESFSIALELDAADDLEGIDSRKIPYGVADRLAALKKLTYPSKGLFGDLLANATALAGAERCALERPTVPVILFVWGPGRILPVRVTSFSVEETLFSPQLHPVQATVNLGLEVMTPDTFRGAAEPTHELAIAAYRYTRLTDDALAFINATLNPVRMSGIAPF